MSRTNILSKPKVNLSQNRNAFDRSRDITFTCSAGMILPYFWDVYTAGSRVKFNASSFIRTAKVNAPAFTPMDFHLEFYKVPIRLLWSLWNDWKLGIQDINSSSLLSPNQIAQGNLPVHVPNFNVNEFFYQNIQGSLSQSVDTAPKDSVGYSYINGALRLADMLNYGRVQNVDASQESVLNFRISTLAAQAYQKIYFDHKRNTAYESNSPFQYNADFLGMNTDINIGAGGDALNFLQSIHNLRYVNYRNDYYSNIYPSLNLVQSRPTGSSWSVPSSVLGFIDKPVAVDSNQVLVSSALQSSTAYASISSVQSIRSAFALDKLLRASSYAPKHVKDQFKARFGVTMSDKVSNESEYLGSFVNEIKLQEVTATASTEDSLLGSLGAKGVGVSGRSDTIETYCEEDSIIMAIGYVLPKIMYDAFGTNQWLSKLNKEEFYQPEFENLGLEPVYQWEFNRFMSTTGGGDFNNNILGYRPRNQVYKLSPDLNHGDFRLSNGRFVSGSNREMVWSEANEVLPAFTTHRFQPNEASAGVNYQFFKCRPSDLNSIFFESYPIVGSPSYDQFFGVLSVYNPSVQNMSVFGQPSL